MKTLNSLPDNYLNKYEIEDTNLDDYLESLNKLLREIMDIEDGFNESLSNFNRQNFSDDIEIEFLGNEYTKEQYLTNMNTYIRNLNGMKSRVQNDIRILSNLENAYTDELIDDLVSRYTSVAQLTDWSNA